MFLIRREVEGFTFFCLVCLAAYVDGYTALEHIPEFLPFMGIIRIGGASGLQGEEDGLHHVLLGIGDNPFDFII